MTRASPAARRRAVTTLAIASLLLTACFGDWVAAKVQPRREAPAPAPKPTAEPPAPTEPCPAYLAEVARRCDRVFDGDLHEVKCHAQIVRVMSLYREGPAPLAHRRRPVDRDQGCTQSLRALPPLPLSDRELPELGAQCRRWAERLRERCVAPLASPPPELGGCAQSLLAFESALGGMTFGRPDSYESQCRAEADRLEQERPDGDL